VSGIVAGKVAIVTGAGRGIGRGIALAMARAGGRVVVCDIGASLEGAGTDPSPAHEVVDEIKRGGGEAIASTLSIAEPKNAEDIVKAALAAFGRVDVLVNNAGGVLGQVGRPLEEITPEQWQAIFDVNVTGAFYCSQAVAPGMKAGRSGRIVNISSGAGLGISLTGIQAYASAKAAQIGLTRQLAHELGPWGITVNNIAPGFVRSNPTTERQWESYGDEGQRALVDRIALKRLGTPDDIAHGVLFFASDYAGWITGQVLSIDGGK
jgi:3-oxoacyl-[acyl-carrier protein] reductase